MPSLSPVVRRKVQVPRQAGVARARVTPANRLLDVMIKSRMAQKAMWIAVQAVHPASRALNVLSRMIVEAVSVRRWFANLQPVRMAGAMATRSGVIVVARVIGVRLARHA